MNNEETKIPLFRRCVLQNFPFIEQDFDALTDYALLCKVVEYLNKVITATNENSAQVEALTVAFNNLKSYVDHYFDNLDVQREINNKLDQMVSTGQLQAILSEQYDELKTEVENDIDETKTYLLNGLSELDTKVSQLSSGSPLVASSTAGMTDTTRIYVNTTDGKWYYYDGDSWEIGGTYQSTGIGENSVGLNSLDSNLNQAIYKTGDVTTCGWVYYGYHPSHVRRYSTQLLFKKGTTITPSADFLSKYDWYIARLNQPGSLSNITSDPDMESYTFTEDTLACIRVDVKSGYWGDEDHPYSTVFTTSDLDLTYYYPILNENKNSLIDLDVSLLANDFFPATFDGGSKQYGTSNTRIALPKIFKSEFPVYITIKSGYQLSIQTWTNPVTISENLILNTGWITDSQHYLVPANTYFSLLFRKSDNSAFNTNFNFGEIVSFTSYPNYTYLNEKITEAVAEQDSGDYSYYGQDLNMRRKRTFNVSKLMDTIVTTSSSQSFDTYGDYLIQFYGDGITQVLNINTKTEVGVVDTLYNLMGHCGSCCFAPEFYNAGDLLPLVYVSSQAYPASVAVARIQTATSTGGSIIKKYQLDSGAGYWSVQCCDFDNKLMYSIGYKQNSYSDSTNNGLIFSIYDMSQETEVSSGVYSLELVERYEMPYVYTIQAAKFLNGNTFMVSSLGSQVETSKVLVFNPQQKKYISIIDDLPDSLKLDEVEDLSFIASGNYYKMLLGTRSEYDLIEFV